MKRKMISIDWKKKFERLKPYLAGKGGLICVKGAPGSARRNFVRLVKSRFEAAKPNRTIIHLNPEYDADSRTMPEILDKLESSLGPGTQAPVGKMQVIRDVNAQGNVNIENLRITQSVNGHSAAPETFSRIRDIAANLKEKDLGERLVIILEDCHKMPPSHASGFWEDFWREGLEPMAGEGLLLICACKSTNRTCFHAGLNISADYKVHLSDQYNESEFKIAMQDIALAIQDKTGKTMREARSMADMLLRSQNLTPANVYNGLNLYLSFDLEEMFDG